MWGWNRGLGYAFGVETMGTSSVQLWVRLWVRKDVRCDSGFLGMVMLVSFWQRVGQIGRDGGVARGLRYEGQNVSLKLKTMMLLEVENDDVRGFELNDMGIKNKTIKT